MTLTQHKQQAIQAFNLWLLTRGEEPVKDAIRDIANLHTPITDTELVRLALQNLELATQEPDIGYVFDGTATAVNLIAANVFETLERVLWDRWNQFNQEGVDAPSLSAA